MLSRGWVFLQALKYGREVVCFFLCLLMQLAALEVFIIQIFHFLS